MADMAMDEGTTRFAKRGPRSYGGEVCGGGGREGKARQGGASTVSDWCLMCSEGVDNQVAREGRGMCLAKQAAGIETSDEQAAASVLGMGEGREKKWIARPGRRDGVRLVRWRRVV
jgi:hypothetical protein